MEALITLLPGDGIGPEVTSSGKKILSTIEEIYGHKFSYEEKLIGGSAIDAGHLPLPEETIASCKESNAIILGAVGGPKWSDPNAKVRPEQGLLGLRETLKVFANIRPIKVMPELVSASPLKKELLENVDLVVIRELTGGIYFGEKYKDDNHASDLCVYHDYEVDRIVRLASKIAITRRKKLASIDKANVLETSRFWRNRTNNIVTTEYPDIDLEHILVDAAAMYLISKPSEFDVIVTENMFGDILTDEASMLAGSMGMLPSASIGEGVKGLYEPIHGSAPDIAGQGIANPCGMILSIALLLRYSLKLEDEASFLEKSIENVISAGARTKDIATAGQVILNTEEMTNCIIRDLKKNNS
jgi:3-isopropylmalate dehydrogenase|tara:strand:- start:130 stop:1203 length:1074 start_codon:yes stop_codon:yes gene_type:complete